MSQGFDHSAARQSQSFPQLTSANLGYLNAEQASVSTVNSGILRAMANFPQRNRTNSYVEGQIGEERVHMAYEAMRYEGKSDENASVFLDALQAAKKTFTISYAGESHDFEVSHLAAPHARFLAMCRQHAS